MTFLLLTIKTESPERARAVQLQLGAGLARTVEVVGYSVLATFDDEPAMRLEDVEACGLERICSPEIELPRSHAGNVHATRLETVAEMDVSNPLDPGRQTQEGGAEIIGGAGR